LKKGDKKRYNLVLQHHKPSLRFSLFIFSGTPHHSRERRDGLQKYPPRKIIILYKSDVILKEGGLSSWSKIGKGRKLLEEERRTKSIKEKIEHFPREDSKRKASTII